MTTEPNRIANIVNAQAAELTLLRIMVMALHDQVPDKTAFLRTFDTTTEDHSVRTMFSTHPESFFQDFEALRAAYRKILIGEV